MSPQVNAVSSSTKTKRIYRKGNPMTATEKQLASVARKRVTHKEVKVFVRNPLKDRMIKVCEEDGLTQAQFIERLIEQELTQRGLLG
ncbi:replication regulatory protein RepA [Serratia sp. JSRIV006]|uniref:replication regulatory protein RepA n=1 Tax=Serratia sp. JSRIV006 TaxID=2831896 RepID=UPI001CC079AC|nr:replication regulatory protein RepA [Serratia sp. JSRIV006]UAN65766.1 replication regulatory protein RepA [Serratia sp. JSRIV006]